jgi:dienelactone hydrolase
MTVFAAACGGGDDDPETVDVEVVGYEVRDVVIPGALHVEGIDVPGKLFVPTLASGSRPLPAVIVLHGSGGLFAMPDGSSGDRPCSERLEPQFARWGERLARLGYVALMPASFDARGFCDWYDDEARIPDDFDDERERLLGRLYDTDAASRHLCDQPEVDCERLGLLGFSNGASTALLALHWQLRRALDDLAGLDDLDLDLPVVPLPAGAPSFQVGVAYYPGCGLESVVRFAVDGSDPEAMYSPAADLYIEHGSEDPLIAECSVDFGEGRRELQSSSVARNTGNPDPYHVRVHLGAEHGFDNAGAPGADEGSGSERPEDLRARDAALADTLEHLADHLGGARRLP